MALNLQFHPAAANLNSSGLQSPTSAVESSFFAHSALDIEPENDDATILESELLKDPLNDRKIKDVPLPPTVALSLDRVFPIKADGERH